MTKKVSNEKHLAEVVRRLYAQAQDMDWEHRSHKEHTERYARWLADPNIGGVLSQWMSPEEQRVWLKDGPLKEFARALAGKGPFAQYLSKHPRGAEVVVTQLLGSSWHPVRGSSSVKPLGCDATDGARVVRVLWGPARDFKHLLWAALEAMDANTKQELVIGVFDTVSSPLARSEKERLTRICSRCGLVVKFIRL